MEDQQSDIDNKGKRTTKFQFKHFLQLIRFENLLMLAFVQTIFWLQFNDDLEILSFVLLLQSTLFLAAAGNVINDFFDVEVDRINKPDKVLVGNVISGKSTLSIYYVLNFFGIISGIALAYFRGKIIYGLLFILISMILFYYSKSLKRIALLGNFIVSFLIAISIAFIYIFKSVHLDFPEIDNSFRNLILGYSLFALVLNFIREIVKDIEDIDGDYIQNMKTIPIVIGRKRTQNIIFYLTFIPFLVIILLVSNTKDMFLMIYSFMFLIIPLGYFMYQIKEVKSKKQFHKLSTLLKIIMLFGMLSVLFF
jgi:4-hydroxybenzoate polyprenyltransferase